MRRQPARQRHAVRERKQQQQLRLRLARRHAAARRERRVAHATHSGASAGGRT